MPRPYILRLFFIVILVAGTLTGCNFATRKGWWVKDQNGNTSNIAAPSTPPLEQAAAPEKPAEPTAPPPKPGTPDETFGDKGTVTHDSADPNISYVAAAAATDKDGAVYVAGRRMDAASKSSTPFVFKYDASGREIGSILDPASLPAVLNGNAAATDILRLQDGATFLLAGSVKQASGYEPFVLRMKADGSIDTGYGNNGVFADDLMGTIKQLARGTAAPDGGFYGTTQAGGSHIGIFRLDPQGKVDASFGSGGVAVLNIAPKEIPSAIAYLPGDNLLIGGQGIDGNDRFQVLAKIDAKGKGPVANFGGNGFVKIDIDTQDLQYRLSDFAVDKNGKIFAVASMIDLTAMQNNQQQNGMGGKNAKFQIERYLADGTPDTAFGQGGKVAETCDTSWAMGNKIVVQEDGKPVVTAIAGDASSQTIQGALLRYAADTGERDKEFGNNGIISISQNSTQDTRVMSVVLDDQKRILTLWQELPAMLSQYGKQNAPNGTLAKFGLARYFP